MHVSSADNLGLAEVAFGILFTYKVNSMGPKTDP